MCLEGTKKHSCPVLSMGVQGTLLWQSALNMSLGMLHYLHNAFLWPRWDMTGATGSLWIIQKGLKARGGEYRVMGRPEDTAGQWGCRLQCTCHCSLRDWRDLKQAGRKGHTWTHEDAWVEGRKGSEYEDTAEKWKTTVKKWQAEILQRLWRDTEESSGSLNLDREALIAYGRI